MSDQSTTSGPDYDPGEVIRPLSVRMTETHRAQLEILADLNYRCVSEETSIALVEDRARGGHAPWRDRLDLRERP